MKNLIIIFILLINFLIMSLLCQEIILMHNRIVFMENLLNTQIKRFDKMFIQVNSVEDIKIPIKQAINFKILKNFEITGYSTDDASINIAKWRDGKTASNKKVRRGFCAADWKVFPKGTILLIENFGICIVEDKGGAIKGNKIDIFFEDVKEAKRWGRKKNQNIILFDFKGGI